MSKEYIIQPEGLSPMVVKADEYEICDSGLSLFEKGELIFFSPHVNTKYVMQEGKAKRSTNK